MKKIQPLQECSKEYEVQTVFIHGSDSTEVPTFTASNIKGDCTVKRKGVSVCRQLPNPSILRTGGTTSYKDFSWSTLLNELASKAPMLLAELKAASGCDSASQKALIPVQVAASVLLYT